jgi:hypothetical protein
MPRSNEQLRPSDASTSQPGQASFHDRISDHSLLQEAQQHVKNRDTPFSSPEPQTDQSGNSSESENLEALRREFDTIHRKHAQAYRRLADKKMATPAQKAARRMQSRIGRVKDKGEGQKKSAAMMRKEGDEIRSYVESHYNVDVPGYETIGHKKKEYRTVGTIAQKASELTGKVITPEELRAALQRETREWEEEQASYKPDPTQSQ